MKLRLHNGADAPAVLSIFRSAVQQLGRSAYTQSQIEAWARCADDAASFVGRLSDGHTVIAEVDGVMAGFGQLHPHDHVEMLYCSPAYAGSGVGTAILAELERVSRSAGCEILKTEASAVARSFFARRGFREDCLERVLCFGAELERFRMRKTLAHHPARGPVPAQTTQKGSINAQP